MLLLVHVMTYAACLQYELATIKKSFKQPVNTGIEDVYIGRSICLENHLCYIQCQMIILTNTYRFSQQIHYNTILTYDMMTVSFLSVQFSLFIFFIDFSFSIIGIIATLI